jgi:hypothetical protein
MRPPLLPNRQVVLGGDTGGQVVMGRSEGKSSTWRSRERRGGGQSEGAKSVNLAMRRVGSGVAGRGGVQIEWNTKLARLGDGCRWFERDQAIFRMRARFTGLALVMGSGEDTTDKIRRDRGCSDEGATHSTFQNAPCEKRRPCLRQLLMWDI